jgi:FkbM family methyltransferase
LTFNKDDLISSSIALYSEWGSSEISFLGELIEEGSVVIDAGAYIGTHTRAFSKLVGQNGKVYSFEPSIEPLELLSINASISKINNIEVHPVALGSSQTEMSAMTFNESNLGSTALQALSPDLTCRKVQCTTLDSALPGLERLDLAKLDIEGMELEALQGGRELIMRHRPRIYTEINNLCDAVKIHNWATENSYATWGCVHDAFTPCNFKGATHDIFFGGKECGLLLTPLGEEFHSPPSTAGTITRLVQDIDDLGLVLTRKPQYTLQEW